jgi:hypothetical protein
MACWVARKPSRLEPVMSQIGLADRLPPPKPGWGPTSYVFSVTPKREGARAIIGIPHAEWLSPCKPTALECPATTIIIVRLINRAIPQIAPQFRHWHSLGFCRRNQLRFWTLRIFLRLSDLALPHRSFLPGIVSACVLRLCVKGDLK